jgi:hypothetical protein
VRRRRLLRHQKSPCRTLPAYFSTSETDSRRQSKLRAFRRAAPESIHNALFTGLVATKMRIRPKLESPDFRVRPSSPNSCESGDPKLQC